jgi:hypothetical protein|tara:strand:- start:16684 stop:18453 length:1770 start_codon:yes stop_codon:yes gene_type:complete
MVNIIRFVRQSITRLSWCAMFFVGLLVCMLGTVGFYQAHPHSGVQPLLTSLYRALQLFTLESGAIDDATWHLEIARWGAAIIISGAMFKTLLLAFEKKLNLWIIRSLHGHVVICGAGQRGIKLAHDYAESGRDVVLVDHLGIDKLDFDLSTSISIFHIEGCACDIGVLQAAGFGNCATCFLVLSKDDDNLAVLSVIQQYRDGDPETTTVQCHIHIDNFIAFGLVIDQLKLPSIELSQFSMPNMIMRSFFHNTSLDRHIAKGRSREIIILGASKLTTHCITQIARSFISDSGQQIRITYISPNSTMCCDQINKRYPQIHRLVEFNPIDTDTPLNALKAVCHSLEQPELTSLFICDDSSTNALLTYLKAKNLHEIPACQIAISIHSTRNGSQLIPSGWNDSDSQNPELFGSGNSVCSAEAIVLEQIDMLAKHIHQKYLDSKLTDREQDQDSNAVCNWSELAEHYKEANRRQADHIYAKLRYIGASVEPLSDGTASLLEFTEAEVDQLAKIEHQRWCAEQYLAGWQHGTDHSTTDLTHPDLVPWDRLSDVVKNYDRQPVNQIPQLLGLIGLQPVRSSLPSIPLNNEESNVAD